MKPMQSEKLTFNALSFACGMLALSIASSGAMAQVYPAKPVRILVGTAPGGPIDLVGRITAQRLTQALGQNFIVENRAGAGGTITTELVARATPDGYTLLTASAATLCVTPHLYSKIGYDTLRDFAPISTVASVAFLMIVHPALPAKTVKEFIALAKSKPGQLFYGSAGSGSVTHLAPELFRSMAGVQVTHVPYKGAGPALIDLMSGQLQFMFNSIPTTVPHISSGRLRALAVSSLMRSQQLPDLPTISESGVPGYDATTWFGLVAPAGTPQDIVMRLNGVILKDLSDPAVRKTLLTQGLDPMGHTPDAFSKFLREELVKWGKVVKISGAKLD